MAIHKKHLYDNYNDTLINKINDLTGGNYELEFWLEEEIPDEEDVAEIVEKKILDYDIKSDILKVGHHGSSYSTLNEFLNKVNPKYAVIEVGKNNIYNHPTNDTLDKLSKRNIKVYRTDINGTIIFTLNGNTYSVETINTDTNG